MKRKLTTLCVALLLGPAGFLLSAAGNPAAVPTLRNTWLEQNSRFNNQAVGGGVDLLFQGDSITWGWQSRGKSVWDVYYARCNAANFGIGGDRIEHVLWRLQNGNLNGITPRVVVLLIGTNNTGRDSAAEIADGITVTVREIQTMSPTSRVILMGIFPRGEKPNTPVRAKIAEINATIAKLADGDRVLFLDIGDQLIQPDGTISREMMPDFLHLSEDGYLIWAKAMQPLLEKFLK